MDGTESFAAFGGEGRCEEEEGVRRGGCGGVWWGVVGCDVVWFGDGMESGSKRTRAGERFEWGAGGGCERR